ncbi:MAG: hypothetical protein FJY91_00295 [Candidatus Harrisonbacteria bacterium]|nr:hypothetical protein [Candidatus Harrisonbacteria bacterium]
MFEEEKQKIANWLLNPDHPESLSLEEAEERLRTLSLWKVYEEIEVPLFPILKDMSATGIRLDHSRLASLAKELKDEIAKETKEIFALAGGEFNLNSPKQVADILFTNLGLKPLKKNSKSGTSSTDYETLVSLKAAHPIVEHLLKSRELIKIEGTYVSKLLSAPERIHAVFNQMGAATGRFSSHDPNMQNIPPVVKQVFIPSDGFTFVSLDYSQIELRLIASLSGDETMIAAFKKGIDIHRLTASKIFKIPLQEVDDRMRGMAKTLNFGIIYGMGSVAFSKQAGVTRKEAEAFIKEYFKNFSAIKNYEEDIVMQALQVGYTENIHGRKRFLPDLASRNSFLANNARRAAINMPVQSLGADVIKLAMIKFWEKYHANSSVKLLLSIHDELLFEIKDSKIDLVIPDLIKIMESVLSLSVPLKVDVAKGKRWSDLS